MESVEGAWELSSTQVFWGEIAPTSHVLQIYDDNDSFLTMLHGFVVEGIKSGDAVIVIATAEHLLSIYNTLTADGFDVHKLREDNQYIPVNSDQALSTFIVNGWPDETLFLAFVKGLISQAQSKNRKVRAFGEMVATLWAQGHCGATVQLEHLWDNFCKAQPLSLFCAYPKSGFTQNANESVKNICCSHSIMIKEGLSGSQLYFINIDKAGG